MPRLYTPQDPISLTKQSFKDECNINKIMAKFQKAGAISHYAKHAPKYGDTTSIELQDALNIIADADSMFEELPSTIRKKFENNPGKFLDFVQNPDNNEEMQKLGLAKKGKPISKSANTVPITETPTPTTPTTPTTPVTSPVTPQTT